MPIKSNLARMSRNEKASLSLINLQREYILNQIQLARSLADLSALILDKKTKASLFRVITKEKLLRMVTTVEIIDDVRRMLPYLLAIYFLEPLIYNLKCILADVQSSRYKLGTGLFLPFLQWDELALTFFRSLAFLQNVRVLAYFQNNISHVHASMIPMESHVFLTEEGSSNPLAVYFNENCADLVLPQVRKTAKAIVNSIVVAEEYPLIRFFSSPQATHQAARLPELIADEVQRQLDDYSRANENYPPPSVAEKPRAILLICDRTLDLYAPLLHEFTYQAMAMDIVEDLERTGVYKYSAETETGEEQISESNLDSQDDETWLTLRHLHIIEASELIILKINELIKNNPMMVDRTRAKTSSDLMYVVAHLQGFDEERRQVTLHKSLIDECLEINANRKLAEFAADFEQNCTAKGTLFEGVKNKHLHDDLILLLARDDLHVNDKMRLVIIYSLYRGGLAESDFVKMAKFIGVQDRQIVSLVQRCFHNLSKLDFPIVKKSVKDKPIEKETFHVINNEGTFNTSRFTPGLKLVLQRAARHELDEEWFPYFRDKPLNEHKKRPSGSSDFESSGSLRNPRVKASWAPSTGTRLSFLASARQRHRLFCFVAGGMTYSEIRLVYELSAELNKDVFIGSEAILRPRDFLIGLQSIDDAKEMHDFDLNIKNDLIMDGSEPPQHLFQVSAPQTRAQPPTSHDSMYIRTNLVSQLLTVSPPPSQKTTENKPEIYQKRVNRYATELTPEPQKEKKESRLRRLFK